MIVKNNQSVFDIATQINGDVSSVLDLCVLNDLSLTETLEVGSEYNEVETVFVNDTVEEYFFSKDLELTTREPIAETEPLGIGTMIIESNFDVT